MMARAVMRPVSMAAWWAVPVLGGVVLRREMVVGTSRRAAEPDQAGAVHVVDGGRVVMVPRWASRLVMGGGGRMVHRAPVVTGPRRGLAVAHDDSPVGGFSPRSPGCRVEGLGLGVVDVGSRTGRRFRRKQVGAGRGRLAGRGSAGRVYLGLQRRTHTVLRGVLRDLGGRRPGRAGHADAVGLEDPHRPGDDHEGHDAHGEDDEPLLPHAAAMDAAHGRARSAQASGMVCGPPNHQCSRALNIPDRSVEAQRCAWQRHPRLVLPDV